MVSNGFLYRMGSIVFMTYTGDLKNIPGGEFSFGQIIPTGYRPVDTLAIGERNNGHLTLRIYADGNINCYNYNEQAISLMNGQITACWITINPYPTS